MHLSFKFLIILFTSIFCISCDSISGHRGMSDSIHHSKKNKTYIKEYQLNQNPLIINDTITFNVNSIWLEHQWKYDKNEVNPIDSSFQLIIDLNEELNSGFSFNWNIANSFMNSFRKCSKKCIMVDFKTMPPDTLNYHILKGDLSKNNLGKKFSNLQIIAVDQ